MARILVVDDEFPIREMFIDMLSLRKHEVVTATNGEEGLQIYKSGKFDAAILDIAMPVMNGMECAREIKKLNSNFPIMLMTGVLKNYSEKDIYAIGIESLVIKPIGIETIDNFLNKYVNQK